MSRSLLLALLVPVGLAALASHRETPQKSVFTTSIDAVRVDVLVRDGKRAVSDLHLDDFQLWDDGILQKVDIATFGEVPVNAILTLDASESVTGERLERLRAASVAVVNGLQKTDQAALVTFNQAVRLGSPLTRDLDAVRGAIGRITPGGGTALYDAVHTGIVLGDSDVGRGLLILFTDGQDTSSFLTRAAVLDTAREGDAVVYAVVAGRRTPFLEELAGATGGDVLTVESLEGLSATFTQILQEFRQRYLLSYTPIGVRKGGWHSIDVRVKGRPVSVRARAGYR